MVKVVGELLGNSVVLDEASKKIQECGYGKMENERIHLSLSEGLYLLEEEIIDVIYENKKLSPKEFYKKSCILDKSFREKYLVYKDLRSRGLLVKTGFKFGTHFRVYRHGVKLKRGPKEAAEHTKWIIHAVPENYQCSYQELARAVRLAHNIRAKMLWAIVDEEGDITYYKIERMKP